MIENLKELNEKINLFVDFVVKTACESTTSGNYFVSVDRALKASEMGYEDFLSYKAIIQSEIEARDEVLELDFNENEEEFDVNCALDYCPGYEWCDGDEEIFGCSYEEWLERPAKPVSQRSERAPAVDELSPSDLKKRAYVDKMCEEDSEYQKLSKTYEAALQSDNYDAQDRCYAEMGEIRDKYAAEFDAMPQSSEPDVYFTVRDMFGDDVGDKYIATFEEALKALKAFCSEHADVADNAMLGMVCKSEDKTRRCVLVQANINKYGRTVLNPMYDNISEEALAVPRIELAALKSKQIVYPFDEVTQQRIDVLEKQLGVFEREVKTAGDLYVGKWRVHIVGSGERYGVNNNLANDEGRSLLEFWDMSANRGNFPNGQFVSRYYIETLFEDKWGPSPEDFMRGGLCLDGGNASVWSVTGDEMTKVFEWLKNREFLPGEHYFEYHCDMDMIDVRYSVLNEDFIREKLNSIAQVRDVQNVERFGQADNGVYGYSFSFKTQANAEAVENAFEKVFENSPYTLMYEEKVVEREKEPLDKVIKDCAAQVKDGSGAKNKDIELEK